MDTCGRFAAADYLSSPFWRFKGRQALKLRHPGGGRSHRYGDFHIADAECKPDRSAAVLMGFFPEFPG